MKVQYIIFCIDGEKKAIISENIDKNLREKIEKELKKSGCEVIEDFDEIKRLLESMLFEVIAKMELELGKGDENEQ